MPNEHLQSFSKLHLEQFLSMASDNQQALVLSAYLEEKDKWEEKLNVLQIYKDTILKRAETLEKVIIEKRVTLNKIQIDLEKKSGIWSNILNFFNIETKVQKRFYEIFESANQITIELKILSDEFDSVLNKYNKTYSNPPDARQYELAMIGNTLFKPR